VTVTQVAAWALLAQAQRSYREPLPTTGQGGRLNRSVAASRRQFLGGSLAAVAALATGCSGASSRAPGSTATTAGTPTTARVRPMGTAAPRPPQLPVTKDPAVIAARAVVPVLCWHQLRDWQPSDGAYARRLLICPPARFRAQLDALAGAGYTTISPDAYLAHLTTGAALPAKPVLLSFDDSQGSQMTEGLPQLRRRAMTAAFFVMTVVLGKSGWMSRDDLRRLDAAGMTVAAHTWDHHRADRYTAADYPVQFDQPRELLEKVVRTPVRHFAYPYGAWNSSDLGPLRSAGYLTAFQLQEQAMDRQAPLLTLRRTLVTSTWSGADLLAQLRATAL